MALIPALWERPDPPDLAELLRALPPGFLDDGLSNFPDSILGWRIRSCGRGHDALYCSRLWPAKDMNQEWRLRADEAIGRWVWAKLPFGLRTAGYAVFQGVRLGGGINAFDSCGLRPWGASAGQMAEQQCRHGVELPEWMLA